MRLELFSLRAGRPRLPRFAVPALALGVLAFGCSPSAKAEPQADNGHASTEAAAAGSVPEEHLRFNGTFVHCPATRNRDLTALRSTLDAAVAEINGLIRGYVRDQLRPLEEHPRLADEFTLLVTSHSIRMDVDSQDGSQHYRVKAPVNGAKKRVKDWDDRDMMVEFRIVAGKMHQTFGTDSGTRENVSFIDENGDLTLDVTVKPRRVVKKDIVYRLHYCRVREENTGS
jgi:hypothetical protein